MKRSLFISVACLLFSGCETYKQQVWTPDSFGYTLQRDRTTGDLSDYFGFNWNLKPDKK
jgi:hypothetical protein